MEVNASTGGCFPTSIDLRHSRYRLELIYECIELYLFFIQNVRVFDRIVHVGDDDDRIARHDSANSPEGLSTGRRRHRLERNDAGLDPFQILGGELDHFTKVTRRIRRRQFDGTISQLDGHDDVSLAIGEEMLRPIVEWLVFLLYSER